MIELKHADVNEVYTIVKDVYSDYLESESSRQQNPLAALAGGSRGGREVTPPRMTLGIEHNSAKLIVSASDELYEQVLSLVESLDQAALDSQRTVRVVQIRNADATSLTNALKQVVPKVTPAQTSTSSGSRSSSSSGGDRSGDRGGDDRSRGNDDDARRDQLRQMFGGGSGSPFSGSRSGFSPFSGSSRGGFSPFWGGRSFGSDRDRGRR
jgi:hypothetical protein